MEHETRPTERDAPRPVEPTSQGGVDRRRADQAHQMDEVGGTPTTPSLPRSMSTGMAKGAVIGAVIGAVLLTPLALAPILDLSVVVRLVIVWIAGAAAGAAAGAVYLAGARAETSNPENDEYVYADGTDGSRREGPGVG